MKRTILYLNAESGDRIHGATLSGLRRYCVARGWDAEIVPKKGLKPKRLAALLAARHKVAGCVVENSDDEVRLPPRLFGDVPVVYLHPPPALRAGGAAFVAADNEAIARAAFRELSAGRPAAYAVIGVCPDYSWSHLRLQVFRALCESSGMTCHVFNRPGEKWPSFIGRLPSWLAALPRHCAVFAVNDFLAYYAVAAARAARISIPHDLTLLGVDNNEAICETTVPTISSIQLDHERAGFLAAKLIGEKISHRCGPETPCDGNAYTVGPLMAVRRKSTGGRGRHEKFVLEAIDMIRREACDGLTAEKLAARFECSRWLFEMRFREATGHSVLNEIQHIRLEKVFTLLAQTDTAIGAISSFCGWKTDLALQKFFRSRTGMTMRDWRRLNRK